MLNYVTDNFRKKKVVICGDWNIIILTENLNSKDLLNILSSYNITAHIKLPTRLNSCLEQIASNIKNVQSELYLSGLSDHETAQMISFKVNKQRAISIWFEYKRDYSKDNVRKFCECMSSLCFTDVYQCCNLVESFNIFYDYLIMSYNL